ncbi:peptide transporter family 1-like isoform X2 [Thrips palmi]|nr:peptide transporter family 1-like isoform X2 [Thrips palmi]
MRTVLSLFLKNSLKLDEDLSTIIYHVFSMLCYFFPVIGAIIADSWLGKYKTIAYLSVVYAIGNIVVSVASATSLNIPSKELTYLGLLLIAIGTGGIKPCVSSFGGEQFALPQQARQLAAFFSVFYFSINAGSLISTWLTPELRTTECMGMDTCYPLSFGVPAILMIVAIVIFIVGKPGYKMVNPKGNIMVEVSMCIGNAIKNKVGSKEKKGNWLDYADAKYSETLRNDIRAVLRVLLLFVPLPVFWALYDQQGSRWTFQANNMNGRLGSWVVKPDQMQVVNPILIMILLPLFESVIYPALEKMHLLRKPLQRIATGGLLGAVAFIISGVLQLQLEPNLPVETTPGFSQVRVFNSLHCNMTLHGDIGGSQQFGPYQVPSMGFWADTDFTSSGAPLNLVASGDCGSATFSHELKDEASLSFNMYYSDAAKQTVAFSGPFEDDLDKDAYPKTRVMYHFTGSQQHKVDFVLDGKVEYSDSVSGVGASEKTPVLTPGQYSIRVDDKEVAAEFLDVGGVYNILLDETNTAKPASILTVITANTINLFWLMPQYIVISVAEIMVSVTGLEFSFTQAPNSMKSLLSSAWLLTDAIGNVIIILITTVKFFPLQSSEFFLFAGLMVAVMLIFIWLAVRYVPVPPPPSDEDEETTDSTASTPSTATPQDHPQKEKE